jgi:hypothetical protein
MQAALYSYCRQLDENWLSFYLILFSKHTHNIEKIIIQIVTDEWYIWVEQVFIVEDNICSITMS